MFHENRYAEGLIHVDGSVYLRGFYEKENKLFFDMNGLKNHLRDNEDIQHYHILMIDKGKIV
jgi:hypothetical protein